MAESPWDALVEQIAEAVVRRLDEREKVNMIAREVILLLEERGRRQQAAAAAAGEAAMAAILGPGGGPEAGVEPVSPSPASEVTIVAPAVGACDCSTVAQDFCEPAGGREKSDE